jgi:hypothetical protein
LPAGAPLLPLASTVDDPGLQAKLKYCELSQRIAQLRPGPGLDAQMTALVQDLSTHRDAAATRELRREVEDSKDMHFRYHPEMALRQLREKYPLRVACVAAALPLRWSEAQLAELEPVVEACCKARCPTVHHS